MKKSTTNIFALAICVASFSLASSAHAKTQGSYAGFNFLHSITNNQYKSEARQIVYNPTFEQEAMGYGLNYKYAVNYNNFYLAPELFYDHIGNEAQDLDQDNVKINNRYGAKLNFGYDISDKFSLFASAGIASVDYDVDWMKSLRRKESGIATASIFGLGASFYPSENVAVNFEFNTQEFDFDAPGSNLNQPIDTVTTNLDVFKIGLAYHF